MAVTRFYPAVTLLLAGIYLLLAISNLCEIQNKSNDFGLNLTLASKRPIQAGLEAMNRCRRELASDSLVQPSFNWLDHHHPTRGFDGRINPILPPLQPNWTNLLTHVFIYIEKATPEGEAHTHSSNRSLAADRTVAR